MNPNAKITDEQFEAYLKRFANWSKAPSKRSRRKSKSPTPSPKSSTNSAKRTICIVSIFPLSMADGTSTNSRSCVFRKSSPAVLAACACTCITLPI